MTERPAFMDSAAVRRKGFTYDEFLVGMVIPHHWGRTLGETESVMFSTMTLNANPTYFNAEFARHNGFDRMPLNPYLIYLTVFGMSVQDLTEGGKSGALIAMEDLQFVRSGFPGDTFYSRSTVVSKRPSSKNPAMGLVTWRTEGFNQHDELVIQYTRTNMMNTGS